MPPTTDTLSAMHAACAALGLRPSFLGETETAIVLFDVDGVRRKVAATDAPVPAVGRRDLDVYGSDGATTFLSSPRSRPSVSRVFAELYADCTGLPR